MISQKFVCRTFMRGDENGRGWLKAWHSWDSYLQGGPKGEVKEVKLAGLPLETAVWGCLGMGAVGLQRPPAPIPPGLPQLLRIAPPLLMTSSCWASWNLPNGRRLTYPSKLIPASPSISHSCRDTGAAGKVPASRLMQTAGPNEEFVWKESDLWKTPRKHHLLRANPTSQADLGTMGIKVSQSGKTPVWKKLLLGISLQPSDFAMSDADSRIFQSFLSKTFHLTEDNKGN